MRTSQFIQARFNVSFHSIRTFRNARVAAIRADGMCSSFEFNFDRWHDAHAVGDYKSIVSFITLFSESVMVRFAPFIVLVLACTSFAQTPPSTPSDAAAPKAALTVKAPETYDPARLPDDQYGRMVRYGKELTDRTFAYIGPEVKNPAMRYAGNNLACSSCHELSATKAFAIPWVGVYASFPRYQAREDEIGTLEDRINGCMERSMAGKRLPFDSREMKAFVTYMQYLAQGVPVGTKVKGQGLPPFDEPDRRADPAAGSTVFKDKCAACHGADGAGVRAGPEGSASGYAFPPLWGKDSFSNGAGTNRMLTVSAFIKNNMPRDTTYLQPQLTDDETYDVAAFVLSHDRPVKQGLEADFPARWNKPVDAAYAPYVDGASADQHRYGPFEPLREKMEALKPQLMKGGVK
jgi:thiosulfate dehydrogenase